MPATEKFAMCDPEYNINPIDKINIGKSRISVLLNNALKRGDTGWIKKKSKFPETT